MRIILHLVRKVSNHFALFGAKKCIVVLAHVILAFRTKQYIHYRLKRNAMYPCIRNKPRSISGVTLYTRLLETKTKILQPWPIFGQTDLQ